MGFLTQVPPYSSLVLSILIIPNLLSSRKFLETYSKSDVICGWLPNGVFVLRLTQRKLKFKRTRYTGIMPKHPENVSLRQFNHFVNFHDLCSNHFPKHVLFKSFQPFVTINIAVLIRTSVCNKLTFESSHYT